ncbi:HalOD1 output domain-containing protein [Halorientalis salina]|uniref:HalOD1 output domain-containing protein n=1 Tax=Halorientalis salina TaxID=2932266 RepID=UPI0010AB7C03|nr:HalOD1 output domain-containing protein [Halorientalis salina]
MGSDRDDPESDGAADTGGDDDVRRTTWELTEPETIPSAVVRAVSAETGTDPLAMPEPLNDVIDADALIALLGSGPGDGSVSVTFELAGQVVTVTDDGFITVQAGACADPA